MIGAPEDLYFAVTYAESRSILCGTLPGDMDCSGAAIDGQDVELFALGLVDPLAYITQKRVSPDIAGDVDHDGDQDFDDIPVFANMLPNGSAAAVFSAIAELRSRREVPESTTGTLAVVAAAALVIWRRFRFHVPSVGERLALRRGE